jgi:hypothetical protein
MPTNIRQEWKKMDVANTLAYHDMATITDIKSCIVQPLTELPSNGRLLTMPTNIRQEWKCMDVANTPAYFDTSTIIAI